MSAAVWWTALAIAFACGAVAAGGFAVAWCRAGRKLAELTAGPDPRLKSRRYNRDDEERLAAEERLGHQTHAWGPTSRNVVPGRPAHGQQVKSGPPASTRGLHAPPPPPARARTLVYSCGCKVRPCPPHELLGDVEQLARTPLGDTAP